MRVIIDVTHQDIEHGRRFGLTTCPVALALRRALGRALGDSNTVVMVCDGVLKAEDSTSYIFYYKLAGNMTKRIKRFICDFDAGKQSMKPFKATVVLK